MHKRYQMPRNDIDQLRSHNTESETMALSFHNTCSANPLKWQLKQSRVKAVVQKAATASVTPPNTRSSR